MIFSVNEEILTAGVDELSVVLERQLSYFGCSNSFNGLLEYLRDEFWAQKLNDVAEGFNEENPCKPIALWDEIDPDFKDLVGKMTNLDPLRRITAEEALKHPWFADAEPSHVDGEDNSKLLLATGWWRPWLFNEGLYQETKETQAHQHSILHTWLRALWGKRT